jgi:hypothetical protein
MSPSDPDHWITSRADGYSRTEKDLKTLGDAFEFDKAVLSASTPRQALLPSMNAEAE